VETRKTMPTVEESRQRQEEVECKHSKMCVYLSNVVEKKKLEEARCINETVTFFFFLVKVATQE